MDMPGGSTSGTDGVVRNSALAFLSRDAQAQPAIPNIGNASVLVGEQGNLAELPQQQPEAGEGMPVGMQALCEACTRIYPTQPNPLQVTTRLKYWLGGHDPLDYISMYWNEGNKDLGVPPHWHYISLGMSDLHGDGRVHVRDAARSGCGCELSLRVREARGSPPLWPAALLQALARYVFATGNRLCVGDHISWHCALDGGSSRLRHLLVSEDPQLHTIETPHGSVTFLQLVGCTSRELRAAQRSSAEDVMQLMRGHKSCGGSWLVNDTRRRRSVLRSPPSPSCPCPAPAPAPSPLAGVAATMRWEHWPHGHCLMSSEDKSLEDLSSHNVKCFSDVGERGHCAMSTDSLQQAKIHGNMSTDSFELSSLERALPTLSQQDWWSSISYGGVQRLYGAHLEMNSESAALIPLAVSGRILHGRHFTWQILGGGVTLVGEGVSGGAVSKHRPYAATGRWLQIYVSQELAEELLSHNWSSPSLSDTETESETEDVNSKNGTNDLGSVPNVPYTKEWPEYGLKISVLPDHCFC